jgi:O-methyltransferase
MIKESIIGLVNKLGYSVMRLPRNIPNADVYNPFFSPWLAPGEFRKYFDLGAPRTLVSPQSCYNIYTLLLQSLQLPGDVFECGVYKGGTAAMMAAILKDKAPTKKLYLFDTYEGMPETHAEKDLHKKGDFSDTSLETVMKFVNGDSVTVFRKGFIPDTFKGLESARVAFAHIDVDIYQSILDSLEFIWPRLAAGGFVVFDDYGFPTCPGARKSVDEFFAGKASIPLCMSTGQAIVFKAATD